MNYGKAKGLKVKLFCDYTDGDVETKLNKFFEENLDIEVIDIQYSLTPGNDCVYGNERALLVYREVK